MLTYVKGIAIFLLIAQYVIILLPNKEFERYVRLFLGGVFIILVIGPVKKLSVKGIEDIYDQVEKDNYIEKLENYEEQIDYEEVVKKSYEKYGLDTIKRILDECNYESEEIKLEIKSQNNQYILKSVEIYGKGANTDIPKDEIKRKIMAVLPIEVVDIK